jgi:signal transduction histidine kinase
MMPFPAMADQDHVVTAISHEVRTPLTAIRGHIEMLAETPAAQDDRVRLVLPTGPVHVIADARLLGVALGHLLRNALGYSAPGRPVHVTVRDGLHPVIEVRDEGPGLAPIESNRLGSPFFRGEVARVEERPGLGLGLTVAQQIVTAQRAVLRFGGAPGERLTVRIEFQDGRTHRG